MKYFIYCMTISLLVTACNVSTDKETSTNVEEVKIEVKLAVCISNGVPVRKEPNKKAKYLSSLNLGETLNYLGESAIDSADNNREYFHVELSDGTVAWARSYGVLIGAEPAAIVDETPVYKRPDLVTKTDKKFMPIEFIAIVNEKEEWVEVVGAGNAKKGWIMKKNITVSQEDVATSSLAYKDLLKDGEIEVEKISSFLEELPYSNTQFIGYLQSLHDLQVEETIMDGIEEYENAEDEIYN